MFVNVSVIMLAELFVSLIAADTPAEKLFALMIVFVERMQVRRPARVKSTTIFVRSLDARLVGGIMKFGDERLPVIVSPAFATLFVNCVSTLCPLIVGVPVRAGESVTASG